MDSHHTESNPDLKEVNENLVLTLFDKAALSIEYKALEQVCSCQIVLLALFHLNFLFSTVLLTLHA